MHSGSLVPGLSDETWITGYVKGMLPEVRTPPATGHKFPVELHPVPILLLETVSSASSFTKPFERLPGSAEIVYAAGLAKTWAKA